MNKLAKTFIIAPALVILAACDISTLSIKRDLPAFRETVSGLKDPGYVEMTITGDKFSSTDLREIYHKEGDEWVADESNETSKLLSNFTTAKDFADYLNKNVSDKDINNYYTFYTGVNSYKIELSMNGSESSRSGTLKFDKYGFITYYYTKASTKGYGTEVVELKFTYTK